MMTTMEHEAVETRQAPRPAPSEAALRAALSEAIDRRRKADERATATKAVAHRADDAMCEAAMDAERLKNGLDDGQHAAIRRHAHAISEALRAGSPLRP